LEQLLTYMFLLHYHDYDVRFILRNGSVGLHLLMHSVVTLPSWLVSANFGTWLWQSFCLILPLFSWLC
jgi:hypothetical protein